MGASLIKFAGPGSVKDVDQTQGLITAYAASFDNRDADGDVIHKGAFAKTINERGPNGTGQIKMLFMHRFTEIIGRVLHLEEDDHGLLFRAKLLLGLQRAKDALVLYGADMFEHSVGIDVVLPENFRGGEIFEVKLFDVSPVTFGANDQTPLISVKATEDARHAFFEEEIAQIRQIRKAIKLDLSDEMLQDLETALVIREAKVRQFMKSLIEDQKPKAAGSGGEDTRDVLAGVLAHIKANPAPLSTKAGGDTLSPNATLAADGPQMEKWLREVLTNLQLSPCLIPPNS